MRRQAKRRTEDGRNALAFQQVSDEILITLIVLPSGVVLPITPAQLGYT